MFLLCRTAVTLGWASHGHTPTPDGQNRREKHTEHEVGFWQRRTRGTSRAPRSHQCSCCVIRQSLSAGRARVTRPLPMDRTAVRSILDPRWGLLAAQDMRNMTGTALSPMFSLCHTAVALGQARTRGMVTRPLPMDRTAVRTSILVVLPCFAFNFEQKTIGPATATSTRTDHSRRKFITLNGS